MLAAIMMARMICAWICDPYRFDPTDICQTQTSPPETHRENSDNYPQKKHRKNQPNFKADKKPTTHKWKPQPKN
jgi:hypothetical protein